ncbi:hypothetical protein AB0E69_12450 [Kribbella sp. NPDC026611]|uniref:hypothetical protein n=1 Tax=Kribbella sp. NPDC026611 TaxID=3154911 RepID=UPI0033C3B531
MVARGDDGLDKLTTTGYSRLWVVHSGTATETVFDPRSLGLRPSSLADLRGGTAAYNAQLLRALVRGVHSPVRDVVLLNAAAALSTLSLHSGPLLDVMADCLEHCRTAVDSGRTADLLDRWTSTSGSSR